MAKSEKLDWIYKGANSLVDREDYLLGRKVDKTLEQINEEEKEKKFILPKPKNHVEHECIPPSIRDFNKIVQAEQVDLSAKLQEDPLVVIKKREEEARRQFLQNPVQLKKLQEALQKKESQKKRHKKPKKRKHSDNDLDEQIMEKLKKLRHKPLMLGTSKKESKKDKEDVLDTILMHKFNALKDKLSEDDLNDILHGRVTDSSDEEDSRKPHKKSTSDSEDEEEKLRYQKNRFYSNDNFNRRNNSSKGQDFDSKNRKLSNKPHRDENSSDEDVRKEENRSLGRSRDHRQRSRNQPGRKDGNFDEKYNRRSRSRSVDVSRRNINQRREKTDLRNIDNSERRRKARSNSKEINEFDKPRHDKKYERSGVENVGRKLYEKNQDKKNSNNGDSDSELDKKIMAQLKLLRGEAETRVKKTMYPEKPSDLSKSGGNSTSNSPTESVQHNKSGIQYLEKSEQFRRHSDSPSSGEKQPTKHSNRGTVSSSKRRVKRSSESSDSSEREKYRFSDSEDDKVQKKSFGLVTSDGKKIALKKTEGYTKKEQLPVKKPDVSAKSDRKQVKKMTEQEKECLRKEMMSNARARDKEREENVKKYKAKDKHEQEVISKKYDADLVRTELLKSAKHSSVEERIKSNLNNIQRSSRYMDQNFSKR